MDPSTTYQPFDEVEFFTQWLLSIYMTHPNTPMALLRCIGCGHKKNVLLDSVRCLDAPPECEKCYMPMTLDAVASSNGTAEDNPIDRILDAERC